MLPGTLNTGRGVLVTVIQSLPEGILQFLPLFLLLFSTPLVLLIVDSNGQVADLLLEGPQIHSSKLPPSARCPKFLSPYYTHISLELLLGRRCPYSTSLHIPVSWESLLFHQESVRSSLASECSTSQMSSHLWLCAWIYRSAFDLNSWSSPKLQNLGKRNLHL